jgi:predicted flap endonuclease-1-like 5' DNA nuclease
MLYLLQTFWLWLGLALGLGVLIAWLTFRANEPKSGWSGLMPWGLVLGLGTLVAALRILPTRPGYWLDLAMLMLAAYLIGCLLAGMLRAAGQAGEPAVAGAAAPRIMPEREPVPALTPTPTAVAAPDTTLVSEVPVEPMKPEAKAAASPDPVEQAITGLSAPRRGQPDDLTQIYGIDPEVQAKLNALGLYHVDQIAALQPGQRRWLFRQLGHAGRFPSWWWRWRFDAEQILAGNSPASKSPASRPAEPVPLAPDLPPVEAAPGDGVKPTGLAAPIGGKADDLKRIKGIGKQNEGRLHGLGIWHFDQIAQWSAEEVKWVGAFLAFPGRIEREDWVGQAKILGAGGVTDFARRADAGEVATSRDDTNDDGQGNVIVPTTPAPKGRKKPDKT